LAILKKVYIRLPVSDFVILKLYLILDGLILLRKGDFCCEVRLPVMVYGGGILGGALKIGAIPT